MFFYRCKRRGIRKQFEYILSAIGRVPNIADLNLEKTSQTLRKRNASFDAETMQCGESNIFFAGDVNGQKHFFMKHPMRETLPEKMLLCFLMC